MQDKKSRYLLHRNKTFMIFVVIGWGIMVAGFTAITVIFNQFLIPLILIYIFTIGLGFYYYKRVYYPYEEIKRLLTLYIEGYTSQGVFEHSLQLSPEIERSMKKLSLMIDKNELIKAHEKQSEYLALQNQINPHFLYNTLEGIRSETLSAGLENVSNMTEALATFFRYTITNVDQLVTLEDEINNVENYYIIQQYRFGNRLNLDIEYDEEDVNLMKCRLPTLTLQPIVENAIYHGIERKIGKGHLRIKIEKTKKRLIVTISDDGRGIENKQLQDIQAKLHDASLNYEKPDFEAKGGIGIINVNSRIKLLFGEEYGLYIYSVENSGTDVEITLPLITNKLTEFSWKKS